VKGRDGPCAPDHRTTSKAVAPNALPASELALQTNGGIPRHRCGEAIPAGGYRDPKEPLEVTRMGN